MLPFLKTENDEEISVERDLTYKLKQNITNSWFNKDSRLNYWSKLKFSKKNIPMKCATWTLSFADFPS